MAQIPPGGIPGNAGDSNQYPQWGLRASDGSIVKVSSQAEKMADLGKGYDEWFLTQQAAQSAKSAQSGAFSSGGFGLGNPLSGLAAIGDFFSRLTSANLWIRVGEVALGLIMLAVGLARITHAVPIATKIAKTVKARGLA